MLESGSALGDVNGDGRLDFIAGGDWRSPHLWWWEQPSSPEQKWRRFLIGTLANKFHTQLWVDVDGDGKGEFVTWNQGQKAFFPTDSVKNEWQRFQFAQGYVGTVVKTADLDGDRRVEIILSEGDAQYFGRKEQGRVAWFKAGKDPRQLWQEHVLANDLVDLHSLVVADFTGNGLPDICVVETDFTDRPQVILFVNKGNGRFETHVVDEGVGSHDARLIRVGDELAIVGKPFTGKFLGEVHLWVMR